MNIFAGEGGFPIQVQMPEPSTAEFWLTVAGVAAACLSAIVALAALYIKLRRKR